MHESGYLLALGVPSTVAGALNPQPTLSSSSGTGCVGRGGFEFDGREPRSASLHQGMKDARKMEDAKRYARDGHDSRVCTQCSGPGSGMYRGSDIWLT